MCPFCDTDFVGTDGPGGGRFPDPELLARAVLAVWDRPLPAFVVATGGEPLLQLDGNAIDALHAAGCEVAVETNGTIPVPPTVDWICVSPKSTAAVVQTTGNELKLVFPQPDAQPERFAHLTFDHFFLQPMDGPNRRDNTDRAFAYCRAHPQWRVSLQTHKMLGVP